MDYNFAKEEVNRLVNSRDKSGASNLQFNADAAREMTAYDAEFAKRDAQDYVSGLTDVDPRHRYSSKAADFMTPEELNEIPAVGNAPTVEPQRIEPTPEELTAARNWAETLPNNY